MAPQRLLITPGEPAGIGPDIVLSLAEQPLSAEELVLVADPEILQARARMLGRHIDIETIDEQTPPRPNEPNRLRVLPVPCPAAVTPGTLNPANAGYVLQTLEKALEQIRQGPGQALVTGPVHKGIINEAGIAFTGHTEWLAQHTGTKLPVMMLATQTLRVALLTTHLPLHQVSEAVTAERLQQILHIIDHDMRSRFGLAQPRIRVCGLNPHAGEDGHLGREELDIMIPALQTLRSEGLQLQGPVPADTAFLPETLCETDVILAMYHDQGLPVLKYAGFDSAVNITLGLPIIRTSVDHGTALELAGSGKASPTSLRAAIDMAARMARTTT